MIEQHPQPVEIASSVHGETKPGFGRDRVGRKLNLIIQVRLKPPFADASRTSKVNEHRPAITRKENVAIVEISMSPTGSMEAIQRTSNPLGNRQQLFQVYRLVDSLRQRPALQPRPYETVGCLGPNDAVKG